MREQEFAKATVAAGEVEYLVTRLEPRSERDDEIGAVRQIRPRVGVGALRPRSSPGARTGRRSQREQALRVLPDEAGHPARVPERVAGEEAAVDHRCVVVGHDRASGTYQRSQPASWAR